MSRYGEICVARRFDRTPRTHCGYGPGDSIVSLKQSFSIPINELRQSLEELDNGCPFCHGHTTTYFSTNTGIPTTTPKLGHGDDSKCTSKLRILRCDAVHFPVWLTFLKHVYIHC